MTTSSSFASSEARTQHFPQEVLSVPEWSFPDVCFIYYLGLRLREFRNLLNKKFRAPCNVLIAEIIQYLGLTHSKEELLTEAETRKALLRKTTCDLLPTDYNRNPKGRGGEIKLSITLFSLLTSLSSSLHLFRIDGRQGITEVDKIVIPNFLHYFYFRRNDQQVGYCIKTGGEILWRALGKKRAPVDRQEDDDVRSVFHEAADTSAEAKLAAQLAEMENLVMNDGYTLSQTHNEKKKGGNLWSRGAKRKRGTRKNKQTLLRDDFSSSEDD